MFESLIYDVKAEDCNQGPVQHALLSYDQGNYEIDKKQRNMWEKNISKIYPQMRKTYLHNLGYLANLHYLH